MMQKENVSMKPQTAILVFLLLVSSAVTAGIDSMMTASRRAQADVDYALTMTLRQCQTDRIDTDTIRVYRSLISLDAVRDTAYLSLAVAEDTNSPTLKANTGLTFSRLWAISDQRASGLLAAAAALWLVTSLFFLRRRQAVMEHCLQMGALCYDAARHRFFAQGQEVHFTPMQQALMELFLAAPEQRLSQQDICDRLWPKKPDSSATLYTLIRRIKPILQERAGLNISCHRGDSYQLTVH